ncbi:indolepyruvate ferredoxin oxidoreductase family protein [Nocardioides immobilis]|uniref:Indolepyruvate ferredoxin oxidoreductase family protein n=1 Tax=Nocardioides immobilis TaxID=2049295 RepID=A0A417Y728_9ACTN|nr:indolepyruvate ferredoxin oxidoreductase family protein [Nocardioides immobilis]RHW28395.1 indolepyruvate ferredoxin oxidoreductase family protein [Nocardioides immobilis]
MTTEQHLSATSAMVDLRDRYVATAGRVQLTGIQALARLPIEQHRRDQAAGRRVGTFISGYEGSPLAGYDLELGRHSDLLKANDIVFLPALNEESAATAVQGSQLATTFADATRDGVLGIWYGKAPGLDRATDAIRHGNLIGADPGGGAVLLVGDDPAAKSSSVPCSSELALADLCVPFLYPADSQDIIELGLHAIELSRVSGLWVGLKIVTAVADGSSTVDLGVRRDDPVIPRGSKKHVPTAKLLQPNLGPLERDLVTTRLRLAREYARANGLNRLVGHGQADRIGIVAAGRTYRDVRAALERLGIDGGHLGASPVRLLRVGMPFPLEEDTVREFASGLDEILVIEEKRSFLEGAIRDVLYGKPDAPRVTGKTDSANGDLVPAYGELDADLIRPLLARRLQANRIEVDPPPGAVQHTGEGRNLLPIVKRAPYFCSGCPHNTSTKPAGDSLVGGGIGCHAMVLMMTEDQVGPVTGLSQMGGEGLQWIGMAPFIERRHYVQNLGDGTFDHSGSLAIRAAVASGVNITYRLLYNSAVAMTGGQQVVGAKGIRQVVDLLRAEGVARVIVTTEDRSRYRGVRMPSGVQVWDRRRIQQAQDTLAAVPGVTVLVHDQECASEKRRKRKRGLAETPAMRVLINERVCEGCGDCGRKSNCLSVHPVATDFGRKTQIHQASCNFDYSCLEGDCPAFVTVVADDSRGKAPTITNTLTADEIPPPTPVVPSDAFGVRLTGVGGTGIVTLSQVLATAGLLAGWTARSLDQTGLAQKGGAVVSDILFNRAGADTTNKLGAGECDLYLGCDLLVAADPTYLAVAAPDRTVAVLSTAAVPTGHMVTDPWVSFPDVEATAGRVIARSRPGALAFDAREIVQGLFGDDQFANFFLVGVAFQVGAIPLPATAVEDAVRLNGVAVDINLQAFRRGRQYAVDPRTVRDLLPAPGSAPREDAESELERLLRTRCIDLTAYQSASYAARYEEAVESIRRRENEVMPGSTALSEAVARNLYKLMAYKDEYEVARLSLDHTFEEAVERQFGQGAKAFYNLHPPVLRALGMTRKLRLGPWFKGVLRVLSALRVLRGTAFDPFGYAKVRRVERELVREFLAVLNVLIRDLAVHNLTRAVQIAALPDLVRGYEEIKMANVIDYRTKLNGLLSEFETLGTGSVR